MMPARTLPCPKCGTNAPVPDRQHVISFACPNCRATITPGLDFYGDPEAELARIRERNQQRNQQLAQARHAKRHAAAKGAFGRARVALGIGLAVVALGFVAAFFLLGHAPR